MTAWCPDCYCPDTMSVLARELLETVQMLKLSLSVGARDWAVWREACSKLAAELIGRGC